MTHSLSDIIWPHENILWYIQRLAIRRKAVLILETLVRLASILEGRTYHITSSVWRISVRDVEAHLLLQEPAQVRLIDLGDLYLHREEE